MGELSGIWVVIFILLLLAAFIGKSQSRGGVRVKPSTKTPKPKIMPAPQKRQVSDF